jgi:putative tryptophan/tyrosine transport system substrate-binding protein
VRAAQQATKIIPILAIAEDLVGSGFVASLAKPGGNTTGVSILTSDLNGKRQEILLEAIPGTHIAALADTNSVSLQRLQELEDAAHDHGAELRAGVAVVKLVDGCPRAVILRSRFTS